MTRDRYTFSNDWFDYNVELWENMLGHRRQHANSILEIGSYEGASTTWLLDELSSHADSTVIAIDAFDDTNPAIERRFHDNVSLSNNVCKLRVIKDLSSRALRNMENEYELFFSLVYVDGSHRARDVIDDAVLSWPMLKVGGIMIFDDYRWHKYRDEFDNPKIAIDAFLGCYASELNILHKDYQVIVQKQARTAEAVPNDGPFIRQLEEAL